MTKGKYSIQGSFVEKRVSTARSLQPMKNIVFDFLPIQEPKLIINPDPLTKLPHFRQIHFGAQPQLTG